MLSRMRMFGDVIVIEVVERQMKHCFVVVDSAAWPATLRFLA